MRGATECAKRLKLLFSSLRSKLGKVSRPPVSDPITQMILGILSRDTPEAKAREGLERLRGMVVDYNELRVIPPIELAETLGDFPDARLKCEDITRSLNRVFLLEHAVSLDRLMGLPRKEVQAYLEGIDGLEAYTRARIRVLGMRVHAIPLDEAGWALARQERIVDPRCPLTEAQRFLERQIAEEDALEFVALFRKHAWSEMGAAVKAGEVARIRSIPPDRSVRNMLQMLPSFGGGLADADEMGSDIAEAPASGGEVALEVVGPQPSAPPRRRRSARSKPPTVRGAEPAARRRAGRVAAGRKKKARGKPAVGGARGERRPGVRRGAKRRCAAKPQARKTTRRTRKTTKKAARSQVARSARRAVRKAKSA